MSDNRTFVSYSRSDSEFALRLAKDLRALGAVVWLDQLDIAAGTRWDSAIEEALRGSTRVLVLLSPKAVASQNVLDEMSFALEEGKAVVPVLVEACTIPLRLRRLQYVDFTLGYDTAMTRLLATLGVAQAAPPNTDAHEPRSPVANEPPIFTPPPASARRPDASFETFARPPVGGGNSPRTTTFVGIAAAVVLVAGVAIWLSSRGHEEAGAPTDTTASRAPETTPAQTAAQTSTQPATETAPAAAQPRVVTKGFFDSPTPRTGQAEDLTELDALIRSLSGRGSLSDDDLKRLAQAELDACPALGPASCSSQASNKVQSFVDAFCARQAGPAPAASDEAATIKHDMAKLSCAQSKMTIVLDAMDQRSKDAIKHIKPG